VAERYSYDPFGVPIVHDATGDPIAQSAYGNKRLYTGLPWLPDLGLYDNRQRLYNPAAGRFLTQDPVHDPANLGNPYTYVGNNPGAYVDPYGTERWGEQSYLADVADVGYGYFIGGPLDIVTGTASAIWNYDETASGLASLGGNLYNDFGGTASNLAGSFYAQFEDSDTAGQAAFGATSVVVPGAAGAAKVASATVRTGRGLFTATRGARVAVAAEAGIARQAAIGGRVQANIKSSQAARAASTFDVHLATEEIYANANKAVGIAKEAGLTNKHGALGMRAHKEFATLNAATRDRLGGRGVRVEVEPYVDPTGAFVERGTRGSLSVDALIQYRGVNVRGFDLKTGRPWSQKGLLERESRLKVPLQQIQR
jgi:RHS repeat-associated protein